MDTNERDTISQVARIKWIQGHSNCIIPIRISNHKKLPDGRRRTGTPIKAEDGTLNNYMVWDSSSTNDLNGDPDAVAIYDTSVEPGSWPIIIAFKPENKYWPLHKKYVALLALNREPDKFIYATGVEVVIGEQQRELECMFQRIIRDNRMPIHAQQMHVRLVEANSRDEAIQGKGTIVIDRVSVEVDLFILPEKPPSYFFARNPKGIPLLLLRLFLTPTWHMNILSVEEWINLVTTICHGSRQPITGEPSTTDKHWLLYESYAGQCKFVTGGHKRRDQSEENYGGYFDVEFWLDSYRNHKSEGERTHVNCYDQAASTEVALSLGMDYRNVAWQYHQTYGFIKQTSLVGWKGLCNNPYFENDTSKMVLDPDDKERWAFRNHAFLCWHPLLHKYFGEKFFDETPNPADFKEFMPFAIDACAGPIYGQLRCGQYVDPRKLTRDTEHTYWSSRDHQFSEKSKGRDQLEAKHYHAWNEGVTNLGTRPSKTLNIPTVTTLLSTLETILQPLLTTAALALPAVSGSINAVKTRFVDEVKTMAGSWIDLPLTDVDLGNDRTRTAIEVYDRTSPQHNFFVLAITSTPSVVDATDALTSELAVRTQTSLMEVDDVKTTSIDGVRVAQTMNELYLTADTLMIKIATYIPDDSSLTRLTHVVLEALR